MRAVVSFCGHRGQSAEHGPVHSHAVDGAVLSAVGGAEQRSSLGENLTKVHHCPAPEQGRRLASRPTLDCQGPRRPVEASGMTTSHDHFRHTALGGRSRRVPRPVPRSIAYAYRLRPQGLSALVNQVGAGPTASSTNGHRALRALATGRPAVPRRRSCQEFVQGVR